MDPYSFYLLDLDWDPHSEKLLDPDPQDLDGECVEKSRAVDPHLFFADLDKHKKNKDGHPKERPVFFALKVSFYKKFGGQNSQMVKVSNMCFCQISHLSKICVKRNFLVFG